MFTAAYLINRLPSPVLNFETPLNLIKCYFPQNRVFSEIPPKVFECEMFVHIHSQNKNKLDPRSIKCIFLGYSSMQKRYKCYSPTQRKFFVSPNVSFHENRAYYHNKDSREILEPYVNPKHQTDPINLETDLLYTNPETNPKETSIPVPPNQNLESGTRPTQNEAKKDWIVYKRKR